MDTSALTYTAPPRPSKAQTAKKKRQADLIDLVVGKRMTIGAACEKLGLTRRAYETWRTRDPEFAKLIDTKRKIASGKAHSQGGRSDAAGGFAEFRKKYFGFDTYAWQQHFVRILEGAPPMSISLVLVPPNHGKTTVVADYINYKLALDPNHRILLISASQPMARKMVGRIQTRMTDPMMSDGVAHYIAEFGPFHEQGRGERNRPWTADGMTVLNATHDEKDWSLEAKGWSSQIYGARADTIILDDVVTKETVNAWEDMLEKFRQEIITRPGKTGHIVIVGTRMADMEFYQALLNEDIIDPGCLIEFPAITDGEGWDPKKGTWTKATALCPELWDETHLGKLRKKVGEQAWWRAYMMRPKKAGDATFTQQMVDDADDALLTCKIPEGMSVTFGLDPALGGGNALLAIAWNHERMWVVDCQLDYGLARTEDILTHIEEFAGRYRPQYVIIEKAAFQRGLCRDDRLLAMGRRYGFQIVEHETAGVKQDPILGVGQMAGSFIRGEISLANGDDISRTRLDPLRAELLAWRPTIPTRQLKQDCVMALWFVWRWWMQMRSASMLSGVNLGSKGLPWKPTGGLLVPSFAPSRWGAPAQYLKRKKAA